MAGKRHLGWKLNRVEPDALLRRFPPRYSRVIADHVTLETTQHYNAPAPQRGRAEIAGRVNDGHGVEALVVEIDGTARGPDGGTYHITWSSGGGRRPVLLEPAKMQ